MSERIRIFGVSIDNLTFQEVFDKINNFIRVKLAHHYIVTPNVDHIVKLQKDPEFRQIYEKASLVLADGMPLVWASRLLAVPIMEKVSGSDLLPRLCEVAAERGYRLFFLGGREGAALRTAEKLKDKYPSIQIVGILSPPFGFENNKQENEKVIKIIKDASPDILFVGLGAPKQEKWIYKHKEEYNVPVSVGIGITFEYVSGMVKRAPVWMQKTGLEWLYRLIQEPGRLWKRYLVEDIFFFGF